MKRNRGPTREKLPSDYDANSIFKIDLGRWQGSFLQREALLSPWVCKLG